MKLKGKIIVVTGGAGLIGKVFCKLISDEGGVAVVADIDLESAKSAAKLIPNSIAIKLDITSKDSINSVLAELKNKFGQVDGLVNNAYPRNSSYGRSFFDVEYSDFCENLNLNLGGYFLTSQLFLKEFFNQGFGNIVNIASIYGVCAPKFEIYENTPMTMPVEYAAIKSSLIHLTKYMAKMSTGKNVNINCISPGGILDKQPQIFLESYKSKCINKGMLDPSDLNGALLFLLSDDSKFMNGQNLVIDDGFTL